MRKTARLEYILHHFGRYPDFDGRAVDGEEVRARIRPPRRHGRHQGGDERMDIGLRQALVGPLLGVVTAAVAGPDVSAWPLRPPPRDSCDRHRRATHHQPRPR